MFPPKNAIFLIGLFYLSYLALLTFGFEGVHVFLKPFLVPCLFIYLWNFNNVKTQRFLFLSILFSTFGDVFLIFEGELFFILGLGAFLVAHLFYCVLIGFYLKISTTINKHWKFAVLLFSYLVLFMIYLGPYLKEMFVPVFIYALTISLMVFLSICLYKEQSVHEKKYIVFGALSFLLSDSILAISIFVEDFNLSHAIVMTTYLIAQSLLVTGFYFLDQKLSYSKEGKKEIVL